MPIEVFDETGNPELARRLDEAIMALDYYRGVSVAHPREAERAAKRGDVARATQLARAVIEAWRAADVEVPAVARMRRLLGKLEGRSGR